MVHVRSAKRAALWALSFDHQKPAEKMLQYRQVLETEFFDRNSRRSKQPTQFPRRIQIDCYRLATVLDPQLPVPAMLQDQQRRPVRPKGINMHIEAPAGTKYPKNLLHHPARLIYVVQHTVGIYVIKTSVLAGNIRSI